MSEAIRVLLADDEPLIRLVLRRALERRSGFTIVGEAADGAQAVALAAELEPDVVVLDLSMPEMDGLEATRRMRAAGQDCAVLIFSSSTEAEASVLAAGADRFVDKAEGIDDVVDAVVALSAARGPRD